MQLLSFLVLCLFHAAPATDAKPYAATETYAVESVLLDWQDKSRDRSLPVKIYFPLDAVGSRPVVIVSHGLGGSREGMMFVGEALARAGYVAVHIQHPGSDEAVWRGADRPMEKLRSAANVKNYVDRVADVKFAIDQITRLNSEEGQFKGKLELNKVAIAGHSFGAQTTQAICGQSFGRRTVGDPRVKCGVAYSPAPPAQGSPENAFGSIRVPMLHLTGTADDSPIGETKAADRRVPFDHIINADQYLVIFTGGDHMVFSGVTRRRGNGAKDERFHDLIVQSTLAFLDAYLCGSHSAREWLRHDFGPVAGDDATIEWKPAAR